jgi:hypothetical protein
MFKFNGACAPDNLRTKKAIVLCLIEGKAGGLISEHQEVIGDDEIKLLIGPVAPLPLFRHLPVVIGHGSGLISFR